MTKTNIPITSRSIFFKKNTPKTVGFEECNEMLILVNYGYNQTIRFRERRNQSLVKVSQTQSNLIDGLETPRHGEIHIQILIIGTEEYGDTLVLVKFETNWMVRLKDYSHTSTQTHVHYAPYLDLNSNHSI